MPTTRFKGQLKHDVDLSRLNSWRIGGRVKQTYQPAHHKDLSDFLSALPRDERIIFLGLGSNVLFPDGVLDATVILTQGCLNNLKIDESGVIFAETGVTCAKLAKFGAKKGMRKAAFFAGVPGTVGGALRMNAGAYGQETWSFVKAVTVMGRDGEYARRTADEFVYGYRHLKGLGEAWFIEGEFEIPKEGDIDEAKAEIKTLLKTRSEQQPIGSFNCGSVFRNPEGDYAARLIDACGLKGFALGASQVSEKHANFMINTGGATAEEMRCLMSHVQSVVEDQTGIKLQLEVQVISEDQNG